MSDNQNISQPQIQDQKQNDKELNFRALEAKYRKELELERNARIEAEKRAHEFESKNFEEDDEEPYVAPKRLEKKLAQFGQNTETNIQRAMEIAKSQAKEELKQEMWLEKNSDFYDIMQHTKKLYDEDREMAETILTMPDNFERQKLVYKTIKKLGLHEEKKQQSSIQEKIDANRRSPYYQPTGVGAAPYAAAGDFSPAGQKNAFEKMQELKNRLRG